METPKPLQPLRVAMVEDDDGARQSVAAAVAQASDLRLMGTFVNGRDALQWLDHNTLDVLLCDLGLPDVPGLAVITFCAQQHPNCEILVLTTNQSPGQVMRALEAGASGYLLKDMSGEDVCARIRELAEGGAPMSPTIARLVLNRLRPPPSRLKAPLRPLRAEDFHPLTDKELLVLTRIAQGFSYREIADQLELSPHTIHAHTKSIYRKLQVHSRTEAVFEARRNGLIDH